MPSWASSFVLLSFSYVCTNVNSNYVISEIYKEAIPSGKFPEIVKISKVTPIFKIGSVSNLGNYRPIAVISPQYLKVAVYLT